MPRFRHPPNARRGLTLVELIVVLAVLAVLAAIAWPTVRRMLGKSELLDAGKQVRTALVQARLRAIESGGVWQFRFRPGTGRFAVAPADASEEDQPPDDPTSSRRPLASIEETLPAGVTFGEPEALDPLDELLEAADVTDAADGGVWGPPVVFQANGRAPDARIRLQGPDGRRLEVAFRGLTGTATIGRARLPESELLPPEVEP